MRDSAVRVLTLNDYDCALSQPIAEWTTTLGDGVAYMSSDKDGRLVYRVATENATPIVAWADQVQAGSPFAVLPIDATYVALATYAKDRIHLEKWALAERGGRHLLQVVASSFLSLDTTPVGVVGDAVVVRHDDSTYGLVALPEGN